MTINILPIAERLGIEVAAHKRAHITYGQLRAFAAAVAEQARQSDAPIDLRVPGRRKRILELLEQHPDGLSVYDIITATGYSYNSIYNILKSEPGLYRDRWINHGSGGSGTAIWCVGRFDDCPRPRKSR